jgi:hypothetical protein
LLVNTVDVDFDLGFSLHLVDVDSVADVLEYLLPPSSGFWTLNMEAAFTFEASEYVLHSHDRQTQ